MTHVTDTVNAATPRVFIVEDEAIVALDLQDQLESLGFEVVGIAGSEQTALQGVGRTAPDMVLMDINLGRGGDGVHAASLIQGQHGVPVVYLTAYAEPETLSRASATQPYGYLLKPFEGRELNATLRMAWARHLRDRHAAREQDSLRQAALAFDSAAEAILILDRDGRVLRVNPAFERLTGWTRDEVVGRTPESFLQARRADDPLREAGAPGGRPVIRHGEVSCLRRDGSAFPAWQHVASVVDGAGQAAHQVVTFSDISALRQTDHRLRQWAYHDALTGLGNRYYLEQCLQERLDEFRTSGQGFGLLFVDLDGFKAVNDEMGHAAGDAVLVDLARRLQESLRSTDVAIRLGGDEFVVLVRQAREADVCALADKLLALFSAPVRLTSGRLAHLSASIGIALFPKHAESIEELMIVADRAMYNAKARGRNGYCLSR